MNKPAYFLSSLARLTSPNALRCANCGSRRSEAVARKYGIFTLRRCTDCRLLFRAPVDPPGHGEEFYQEEYAEGVTTDMPSPEALEELKRSRFAGTNADYTARIELLRSLGLSEGARIFEFGCSWGYGAWQMAQAGFEVEAYELSRPRRTYAERNLEVRAHDRFPIEAENAFDAVFSAHVLEHVPSPETVLNEAFAMVKPGGLVITIVPNGGAEARQANPGAWMLAWGAVHPNMIDSEFLKRVFGDRPNALLSTDGARKLGEDEEALLQPFLAEDRSVVGNLSGSELIAIARRPG